MFINNQRAMKWRTQEKKLSLSKDDVENAEPDSVLFEGYAFIEHPRFNQAKNVEDGGTLEEDDRSTKVKIVVFRGGIPDWCIYHSMDANITRADYFDDPEHLEASYKTIATLGAKVHNRKVIRSIVDCTDEVYEMYRH